MVSLIFYFASSEVSVNVFLGFLQSHICFELTQVSCFIESLNFKFALLFVSFWKNSSKDLYIGNQQIDSKTFPKDYLFFLTSFVIINFRFFSSTIIPQPANLAPSAPLASIALVLFLECVLSMCRALFDM